MKARGVVFGMSILMLVLAGCTQRMIDFTIISSKNVTIPTTARGSMSEGEDWVYNVFGIPIGGFQPSLEEAVDRAIEAAGPEYDALMDGVVYWKMWYAVLAVGTGYRVKGIPINTKALALQNPNILDRLIVHSSIREQYKEVSEQNLQRLYSSIR